MESKASLKNNHIVISVPENLTIWADNDRILQIIINIVNNAIQFSEDSDINIRATKVHAGVSIEIEDHGIGIEPEKIKSIWERFYKADISRKNTEFGESGIGLAVVKSLVEAHSGTVEVESELGQGTKFIITIPDQASQTR